ncbi:MAG: hypothetical protein KGI38_02225 [Thaumarchaeota archaeon]|nr:hypothetical protein [Nitrososphaerota archaeon]
MPILNRIFPPQPGNLGPGGLQQNGPTVEAEVAVPSALEQLLRQKGQSVPPPVKGNVLVDTGATMSAVDDSVIRALGVSPIGVINTGTAGGPQTQSLYPARFILQVVGWTFEFGRVTGANLSGTGLVALIGRDVLSSMLLEYNGPLRVFTLAI